MNLFPEMTQAEIKVKKIMLEALEAEKKKVDPFITYLTVEIDDVRRDIQRLEKDLKNEK